MNIETIISEFGNRLKKIRKEKGLTQDALAEISNVSRRAIANYESSASSPPADILIKLASSLNMGTDELLGLKKVYLVNNDISEKVLKKARLIDKLPTRAQNEIFKLISEKIEKCDG